MKNSVRLELKYSHGRSYAMCADVGILHFTVHELKTKFGNAFTQILITFPVFDKKIYSILSVFLQNLFVSLYIVYLDFVFCGV
jgi:hypothetical protein